MKYILEYSESHYHSDFNGGFYGGLTICTREFTSYAKLQEYILHNVIMWDKNHQWGGKKYRVTNKSED